MKLGLIAGNGKFPFLVLEGAKRAGTSVAVAAIREETDPAIESLADRMTWVGIGQLGKMLRFFKDEGVDKAIMAGQVKHVQIFSRAIPDVRMLKMLLRLPRLPLLRRPLRLRRRGPLPLRPLPPIRLRHQP